LSPRLPTLSLGTHAEHPVRREMNLPGGVLPDERSDLSPADHLPRAFLRAETSRN